MKRLYIGLTWSKAQLASGIPTIIYEGPSLPAAKAAINAAVNTTPAVPGTAIKGEITSNTFFGQLTKARQPANA
jgi:hypothetical protein